MLVLLDFLPTIVAVSGKKANAGAIGILNFMLGWTLIGAGSRAVVWAATKDTARAATVVVQAAVPLGPGALPCLRQYKPADR